MKLKVCIAFVAAVFAAVSLCAQEVGDKIQKEFTVNGEKVTRMVKYTGFAEYDSNGNKIYEKTADNLEEIWLEYNSNGNLIHYKSSSGYEAWNEYDSSGKLIHLKNTRANNANSFEVWHEYDSKGNEIHFKNNEGAEV